MPATPGRSLQCCCQHTDSDRSGWADRADMKRDCCVTSAVSAARQRQRPAGQGRGPTCLPPKPAHPQASWGTGWQRALDRGPFQTALQSQGGEADPATPHPALVPPVTDHVGRPHLPQAIAPGPPRMLFPPGAVAASWTHHSLETLHPHGPRYPSHLCAVCSVASVVSDSATLWTGTCQAPLSMGKNTGVGCCTPQPGHQKPILFALRLLSRFGP